MKCNREQLIPFLSNKLDVEDKLDFLSHLENCSQCWDLVYNSIKAQHPHYYKSTPRPRTPKKERQDRNKEEIYEVA